MERFDSMTGYYDYKDLRKAYENNPTQENLSALGEWFERHGWMYWDGESYDADNGLRLYPVYREYVDENGDIDHADVIGYDTHRTEPEVVRI